VTSILPTVASSDYNLNESVESQDILSIPYSSNIIGITGMDGEGGQENTGPESFFITEDNHIYILDSNNYQILNFYNGEVVETIKVDTGKEHMIDITIADKYIYILLNNDVILKVDNIGTVLEKIDISSYGYKKKVNSIDITAEIPITSKSISYEDGCLKVMFKNGKVFNLTNKKAAVEEKNTGVSKDGFTAISLGDSKIKFPSFSQATSAYKVKSIKDYDIYYTSEIFDYIDGMIMDRRLYFTDAHKIVKYVQLEQEQFSLPNRLYRVMEDGTVYQMVTLNDSLFIKKLGFLTDYSSAPSYVKTKKNEIVSTYTNSITNSTMYLSSTPGDVANRVQNIVYYTWSYNPATNGSRTYNTDVPSSVVQPCYLVGYSQIVSRQGIPYNWGGARGIDVTYEPAPYNTTFPQAVAAGKYTGNAAGNISTPITAGVDCSGLVSVAFQLGQKYGTGGLVGTGCPFRAVTDSPQSMDIYNHSGDHVFIFDTSTYVDGALYYYIYEATTTYNYRGGGGAYVDRTVSAAFYVDQANLTGYVHARRNGW
jgi:hypothetical protein